MDIVVPMGGRIEFIDVSVRQGAAGSAAARLSAARRDGMPSRRAEQEKHLRYPVDNLVAFIIEGGGRLGDEARAWLRAGAEYQEAASPHWELTRAHRLLSAAVQGETARALRKSYGLGWW